MTEKIMWAGPVEDGHQLYFCLGKDIPEGWERRNRTGTHNQWEVTRRSLGGPDAALGLWYQIRKPTEPRYLAKVGDGVHYVVLWGEMKDRSDLDQWEMLTAAHHDGGAQRWARVLLTGAPDDYPIRVRRKSS